ncbi:MULTISPECIES: hypothetical protein [Burkholderia]|jgi:hypothetical protein|uniref:hypothetical protein n=1 Tax=Burkholderia TaxID=32008 RepID=UPI000B27A81E|nr:MULTISPECIES: hypothetical protein [Burkholderia]MBG0864231.1 hypothetical protein [Burkholderia sp. 9779_493]MBJ9692771.1 hypothetical protein [Burkholderia cenocepacia]MBJ9914805.1 hypothetical protein [Burkholderia cenocepacia]MBN3504929.1 hypothetical protein [Burkholderia cenocepacia]MBN3531850.1 hypothetical protein [Burkholderia cenocepacia]
MLVANTSRIRFVAILALGPSGGRRKPVISMNGPHDVHCAARVAVPADVPAGPHYKESRCLTS